MIANDLRRTFLSRLEVACARSRPRHIFVGLIADGLSSIVETDADGVPRVIDASRAAYVAAGCLTKPITASLLAESVAAGKATWDTALNEVLDIRGTTRRKLSRVRLMHLLDHTHGLDSSLVGARVPRSADGFIDVSVLCEHLAARPLSEPGELYSYGNIGAHFAGAVLERICGITYAELLGGSHLFPRGSNGIRLQCPNVCPATGDTLELTTAHWLYLLGTYLGPLRVPERTSRFPSHLSSFLTHRIDVPGWSPGEQAACMGWKYYGGDWYGHNANSGSSSALVRFNPNAGVALAIMGSDDNAFLTLACLLGPSLPELAALRRLRDSAPRSGDSLPIDQYVGDYAHGLTRIEVTSESGGRLLFTFGSLEGGSTMIRGALRPAQNELFFTDCQQAPELPFLQFIRAPNSMHFSHVWNGKQLWRRDST